MAKATKAVRRVRKTSKRGRSLPTLNLTKEAREIIALRKQLRSDTEASWAAMPTRGAARKEALAEIDVLRSAYEEHVTAVVARIAGGRRRVFRAKVTDGDFLLTLAVIGALGGSGNSFASHALVASVLSAGGVRLSDL